MTELQLLPAPAGSGVDEVAELHYFALPMRLPGVNLTGRLHTA